MVSIKDPRDSINWRDPNLAADAADRAARRKFVREGATKATTGAAGKAEGDAFKRAVETSSGE